MPFSGEFTVLEYDVTLNTWQSHFSYWGNDSVVAPGTRSGVGSLGLVVIFDSGAVLFTGVQETPGRPGGFGPGQPHH